ncbi:hypothetical protein DPMN_047154 [Dreissena polymorpha]|uniref:Uncharacterized protein n=1 Tax=Dreissena polymorpha TaxID=45954 RepID=A0A9D4DAX9_DREPO|nr:hypothetical protein DPMN_047154 [Dreissena polymorpha]
MPQQVQCCLLVIQVELISYTCIYISLEDSHSMKLCVTFTKSSIREILQIV